VISGVKFYNDDRTESESMHTLVTLLEDLRKTNINKEGTVLVHSSMKAIGEVFGGANAVLDALTEFMRDGLLLLPTHTWDENNLIDNIYDVRTEKSCVGILSEIFRQRPDVVRSMHPSHSVAAFGKRNREYVWKDWKLIERDGIITPCPRYGCFGSLYDENAQILFLGAPLKTNTYLHGVEEILDIPDRLKSDPRRVGLVDADGNRSEVDLIGHHNSLGDVSQNYGKIKEALMKKGFAKECTIGDATCYVIQVKEMTDMVLEFLRKDQDLFLDDRPLNKSWF